jgi:hypothetical protein
MRAKAGERENAESVKHKLRVQEVCAHFIWLTDVFATAKRLRQDKPFA